ncbi:MAG: SIMPL domain-containing protein [Syntrophales bacterium]|nr:SIMPL domain-containing protein [Syntrophales bacterium]MDD5641967.1 SIMPL domain-containing protein [Syntrophales bacterium]
MRSRYLPMVLIFLLAAFILLPQARGAEPDLATISVDAEGKVLAKPDMATLQLEVETQAPQAEAAAQENARRSDALLKAIKKVLQPDETIQSLSYRLNPLRNYRSKEKPEAITGYQAVHRFKVEVKDPLRLALVLDTALANGASRVNGPFWGHSRLAELQRQAAVQALSLNRQMADALAQAGGVKIKGLYKASTHIASVSPRGGGVEYLAAKRAVPTPIEVGEEEIRVRVTAVFAIGP